MTTPPDTRTLAHIAHEANRAYCRSIGDDSQPAWDDAPDWQRDSAVKGIEGALAGNTPEQQHQSWLDAKVADGWVYGDVKDPDAKTHPCIVPYADLPAEQQVKDHVYSSVVRAAQAALTGTPAATPTPVTRAKFTVSNKTPSSATGQASVMLHAVIGNSPENALFFAATPNGQISLTLLAAGAARHFEPGNAYYVDFTPADG